MATVHLFNREGHCVMRHVREADVQYLRIQDPCIVPPQTLRICDTGIEPQVIEQACPCGEVIWRREVPQPGRQQAQGWGLGGLGFFGGMFDGSREPQAMPPQMAPELRNRVLDDIARMIWGAGNPMADPLFALGLDPRTNPSTSPETKATAKARELLRQKLTPAQQRTFDKYGVFFVIGPSGTMYKVTQMGVELDEGRRKESLCVYPKDKHEIPIWDTMLAQKLAIEADEEEFLKTANHFPR